MSLTDEQFATTLRHRAAAATPPMALDVDETVRMGARRRLSRRLGGALGAVAGVAAIAVAAATVIGGPDALRRPVEQVPVAIGSGQVAELAPGVTATNGLVATTASDGSRRWDTGLRFDGDGDGAPLSVGFAPLVGIDGDGIAVGYDEPTGRALRTWGTAPLTWSTTSPLTASDAAFRTARVLYGVVPASIRDPHVLLYAPAGLPAFGGDTARWLELPTVRDPQGSERLLFAAVIQAYVPWGYDAYTEPRVLVVAGDGSTLDVSQVCGAGLTSVCLATQPDGGAALAEAVTAMGGTAPALVDPPVVEVVRGVEAATGPFATDGRQAVVGTLAGARVVVDRLTDTDPDVMQLAAYARDGYFTGTPQDLPLGPEAAEQVASFAGAGSVHLLVAPAGWTGARAFVWSTQGWATSDAGRVHAVEVPMFTLPVRGAEEPGRLFAAVGIARPATPVPGGVTTGVAVAAADGTLVVPGCFDDCQAAVPYDELNALLAP